MLCRSCRRQVGRGSTCCPCCGVSVDGRAAEFDLVLPDGVRVPLAGEVVIGRAAESTVRIANRSVSRRHARVTAGGPAPVLEDAGSSHGTLLDGRPVTGPAPVADGATIGVGDVELRVERRRAEAEAGRTIVVPANASVVVGIAGGTALSQPGTEGGFRPRMRPGWKLKRLDEGEGRLRFVLASRHMPDLLRMGADDAAIVQLLDGEHALPELMAESERRYGSAGVARLARLLAHLGERNLLEGVDAAQAADRHGGRLARLTRPREHVFTGTGPLFERLYRRGGYLAFTRPGLAILAAVAVAGAVAFAYLIAARGGTPFVVADRVGLGGLVFLAGRFIVVLVHESAHGLTMASFGRRVPRGGVKAIAGVPFAFVDTTEGWFEPRRRRLAISGAGPASDLVVGGAAALAALGLGGGSLRDILYQIALAAYVGALYNANPFLDRDGYHMLVDWLREPGLRRRARERLARRLAGEPAEGEAGRALVVYGVASIGWMLVAAGFVILMTLLSLDRLRAVAPPEVVWTVLVAFYLLLFVPIAIVVGRPLARRWRGTAQPAADAAG